MRKKLNFTITQNKHIYNAIVNSNSYEEFIAQCGDENVDGYKNGKFKEKRFKETLTDLVKNY